MQGLVRGPFVKVDKLDEDTVFSWPNLLIAELFVLLLTIAGVMAGFHPSSMRRWSSRST